MAHGWQCALPSMVFSGALPARAPRHAIGRPSPSRRLLEFGAARGERPARCLPAGIAARAGAHRTAGRRPAPVAAISARPAAACCSTDRRTSAGAGCSRRPFTCPMSRRSGRTCTSSASCEMGPASWRWDEFSSLDRSAMRSLSRFMVREHMQRGVELERLVENRRACAPGTGPTSPACCGPTLFTSSARCRCSPRAGRCRCGCRSPRWPSTVTGRHAGCARGRRRRVGEGRRADVHAPRPVVRRPVQCPDTRSTGPAGHAQPAHRSVPDRFPGLSPDGD